MKNYILSLLGIAFLITGSVNAQVLPVPAKKQNVPVVLTGGTIHTGTGKVIKNGVITFNDGVITAIGEAGQVPIPGEAKAINVEGKHIYPGLILMNTNLGLSEIGMVDVTHDYSELGQINPGVRSLVAYNTDSHVIPVVRSNGILLAQVAPTGGLLSGTSSVMQLDAWNWEDAAYDIDNGIHLNWPRISPPRRRGRPAAASTGEATTFEKNVKQLDQFFNEARAYAELSNPERTNLRFEAMKGVFSGEKILYINVSEAKGILTSVNFAREHGVKKVVLVNVGEDALLVKDFIKENDIPVILGRIFSMPAYEHSDTRMPFKMAKLFNDAGILTGLTYSGSSSAYNLPFTAGQTVAYGLPREDALKMITLNNAKILGIEDRTGSLEKGKDANIIVSTGDILDMMTNNIELAYINGRSIDLDNKFKMLYNRFQEKYK